MKPDPNQDAATGLVFNIQRFSVHDGPGIRTTVFLKGCPLRCDWCANPESQALGIQMMARDILCVGCGACVAACPKGAISIHAPGARKIDRELCDHCLVCVDVCAHKSLRRCGEYLKISDVLDEILRDRAFYKNSGGGVTVSGGEPLLQSEFVMHLLRACKEEGLHTAVDTSGHVPWQKIQDVLPYADLLLWDIKHLDSGEHERTTFVGNGLILENLEKAAGLTRIWLRIPPIAGFNDSVEHIQEVARLARRINAEKVSLPPFHEGGRSKNQQIGMGDPFPEAQAPTEEHIDLLRKMMEQEGIKKVGIGN